LPFQNTGVNFWYAKSFQLDRTSKVARPEYRHVFAWLVSVGLGPEARRDQQNPTYLKLSIIDAAVAYGSDGKGNAGLTGYLYFLAGSHPKAFAGLLGRTLPYQINTNSASTVGTVNIVSIPVSADISKLTPALVVENAIENAIVEDEQRDDQDLDDPGAGQPAPIGSETSEPPD